MSKSGRRRREGSVEEEVLERQPWWRQELWRMLKRIRDEDESDVPVASKMDEKM